MVQTTGTNVMIVQHAERKHIHTIELNVKVVTNHVKHVIIQMDIVYHVMMVLE